MWPNARHQAWREAGAQRTLYAVAVCCVYSQTDSNCKPCLSQLISRWRHFDNLPVHDLGVTHEGLEAVTDSEARYVVGSVSRVVGDALHNGFAAGPAFRSLRQLRDMAGPFHDGDRAGDAYGL